MRHTDFAHTVLHTANKSLQSALCYTAHTRKVIYNKQDRQYTYNVTTRRVRAAIVAVEKQ